MTAPSLLWHINSSAYSASILPEKNLASMFKTYSEISLTLSLLLTPWIGVIINAAAA